MDGRWLALGTIGVLAVAGARRRGSAAKYDFGDEWRDARYASFLPYMPHMTFYAWTDRGRYNWATPSYVTAKAWARKLEKDGLKRVNTSSEPSRSAKYIGGINWLLPNGDLAYDLTVRVLDPREGRVLVPRDLEVRPTLSGPKVTQTNFLRLPISMLDPATRRRLETIWRRTEEGHAAAVESMISELCELRAEGWFDNMQNEQDSHIQELGWLQNHEGDRSGRSEPW